METRADPSGALIPSPSEKSCGPAAGSQHRHGTSCCFSTCQKQPLWRFHTLRPSLQNCMPTFELFLLFGKAKVTQQLNPQDISSCEVHRGFIPSLCAVQLSSPVLLVPSQQSDMSMLTQHRKAIVEKQWRTSSTRVMPVKIYWLDLPVITQENFQNNLSHPAEQTNKRWGLA